MDVNEMIASTEIAIPEKPLPPEIAAYEDEQDPLVKGPWRIESLSSADWALARLAECEQEESAIVAQADAAITRIQKRAQELCAKVRRGAGYFRFKLMEYAERNRAELLKGTKKSRDFVHGRISWRKTGGRLKVVDKQALEAWLYSQPIEEGLYRLKVEPEMKALQARAKRTGEVFPGCEWEVEHDEVSVQAVDPAALPAPKE